MYKARNQPDGSYAQLSARLDALAPGLSELRAQMGSAAAGRELLTRALEQSRGASAVLRQSAATARQLAGALARPALSLRPASACAGGSCGAAGGSGTVANSTGTALGSTLAGSLGAALRTALSGDFQRTLQSLLSSLTRSLAGSLGRAVGGGGLGGSLLTSLIGGGLSLLIGKLLHKRQAVSVENTVKSEVLNFPHLLSLDFAANPASRLFGNRAVARGPAFSVEVSYRQGAEDVVTAKVASRLAALNLGQGLG